MVPVTAKLHADHQKAATPSERLVERTVGLLGRPGFIGVMMAVVLCWTGGNVLAIAFGHAPIDAPPFAWLELGIALSAFCVTVLILATQRRDDQLAQQREQMTLEFAVLSEQKLAKIIELLEESRRDNPLLGNRVDPSAEAMATPADPHSLGDAIKRSQEDAKSIGSGF